MNYSHKLESLKITLLYNFFYTWYNGASFWGKGRRDLGLVEDVLLVDGGKLSSVGVLDLG